PKRDWSSDVCSADLKLRIRHPRHIGPVDNVRLAPHIPAVKVGVLNSSFGRLPEQFGYRLAHARMIQAVARSGLGNYLIPALGLIQCFLAILFTHPVRR